MHLRSFKNCIKYVAGNIESDEKVKKFAKDVAEFIEHVIITTSVIDNDNKSDKDESEEELLKEAKTLANKYVGSGNIRGEGKKRRVSVQQLIKNISGNERPTKLSELSKEQLIKFTQMIRQRGNNGKS